MIPGIDISHYQTVTSWPNVAEQMKFCYIKATDGVKYIDPSLADHVKGASDHGIPIGLYHFFRDSPDAGKEAEHFLESFHKYHSQLPPVLDLEITPVSQTAFNTRALAFLDDVADAVKPMVYASPYFILTNLTDDFTEYPLWVAHYTTEAKPYVTRWSDWTFWQWTPSADIDGIEGVVDLDWCVDQSVLDSLLRLPT